MSEQFGRNGAVLSSGPVGQPNQNFGVLACLSRSFSLYFSRLPAIFLITLVALIPSVILLLLFQSPGSRLSNESLIGMWFGYGTGLSLNSQLVSGAMQMLAFLAVSKLIYQTVLEGAAHAPAQPIKRVLGSLRQILPLIGVVLVIMVALFVPSAIVGGLVAVISASPALLFLIVPLVFIAMFYVMALFSVSLPSLAAENTGLSALGRSISLTKGYRFALVGANILAFLIYMIGNGLVLGLTVFSLFSITSSTGAFLPIFYSMLGSVMVGVAFSFLVVVQTVALIRLKTIKEGFTQTNVADVF